MRPSLNLSPLLETVLPQLPSGPARLALLRHMVELVSAPLPAGSSPSPSKVCTWEGEVRRQMNVLAGPSGSSKEELKGWTALHQALLARWPMWDARCAWGWHALAGVMERGGSGRKVLELLNQPGAPTAVELTQQFLPSPASKTPPVFMTLLGWLLSSSERPPELIEQVLELGVDPNAPCTPDKRLPLSLAFDPDHIAVLRARGACLGSPPLAWLPAPTPKGPQVSVEWVSAQLLQWNAMVGEGDEGFAREVAVHLPELTRQFARFLVSSPSDIRQFRALGRKVGVDVARPGSQDPSLRGELARALLVGAVEYSTPTKSPLQFLEGKPTPQQLVSQDQAGSGPWMGLAGGLSASVWGWLEVLSRSQPALVPSRWMGDSPEAWWDEVGGALEKLQSSHVSRPHAPLVWRLWAKMAPFALTDDCPHAASLWRAQVSSELSRCVAEQLHDSHVPMKVSASTSRPKPNTPAQLWQGPIAPKAWKEWMALLSQVSTDFLAHPDQYPAHTGTTLLQAHVLSGLSSPSQAMRFLREHRARVDENAVQASALAPLARSRTPAPTPLSAEFWLELSMPAAGPVLPKPRF